MLDALIQLPQLPFQISKLPVPLQWCIFAFVGVHVLGVGLLLAYYYFTAKPAKSYKQKLT
jgi:hypothetical protein